MPCSDGGWPGDAIVEHSQRADRLARMLCGVMTTLKAYHPVIVRELCAEDKELADWWKQHQEFDRRRIERENADKAKKQAKNAALAKLTPEERKALGL